MYSLQFTAEAEPTKNEQQNRLEEIIKIVEFAKRLPLFAGLEPGDHQHVAEISSLVSYQKGEFIFRTGERGNKLFVIVKGHCHVVLPSGIKITRSEGDFFGERGMIDDAATHSADIVVASGSLLALSIDRGSFR